MQALLFHRGLKRLLMLENLFDFDLRPNEMGFLDLCGLLKIVAFPKQRFNQI